LTHLHNPKRFFDTTQTKKEKGKKKNVAKLVLNNPNQVEQYA
jgi:hypothetical protein